MAFSSFCCHRLPRSECAAAVILNLVLAFCTASQTVKAFEDLTTAHPHSLQIWATNVLHLCAKLSNMHIAITCLSSIISVSIHISLEVIIYIDYREKYKHAFSFFIVFPVTSIFPGPVGESTAQGPSALIKDLCPTLESNDSNGSWWVMGLMRTTIRWNSVSIRFIFFQIINLLP